MAQVVITSLHANSTSIGPSSLFHTTLQNSGPIVQFWFEGEILDKSGTQVLAFNTTPQQLAAGVSTFNAGDLRMRTFSYASTSVGRIAQQYQRLPGGNYHFCLKCRTSGEGDDELCEDIEVDEFLTLDLVHPWNKATIDELRPTLTWALTSSGPPRLDQGVRLVLVPLKEKATPAQALAAERPLFMLPDVKERAVPYPAGMPDLVPGQCYAWQVERVDGPRVLERSEPWGFCVRIVNDPIADRYVRLEDIEPGSLHRVIDERVHFRYDEAYASETLRCTVHQRGSVLPAPVMARTGEKEDVKRSAGDATPRSIGMNLYEFDLTNYSLAPGTYTLLVQNEKGRSFPLHFLIER